MKIKLTEKFSIKRKGDVIDVSEVTAEMLIAEGKATAAGSKAKSTEEAPKKGKQAEQAPESDEPKDEPQTDAENIVIE